jgi:hypothetical protein
VRPAPDMVRFERPMAGFFQPPREGAWRCARDRRAPRDLREKSVALHTESKSYRILVSAFPIPSAGDSADPGLNFGSGGIPQNIQVF